ncbi:hypothetical protein B0H17DRAFT_482561 [Mycena rosella]|uniref:Uncharacterized protein n=1 Tax=Mycena rosella TaxID=1033263 RepID=A0AAD7DL47_MYCRO|nr:hypothetical protein B0H17DRAFT_482561 [Mycena rosella]
MLANDTITPRPRPPAQMRRSSTRSLALGASPPPPYASSAAFQAETGGKPTFPSYLGSPLPATLQMVGLNSEPASPQRDNEPDSPNTDGQLKEKSREELAELLLKAGDLIKERETELGVTSAVCRSLHESNITLKSKHDALVARIPPTPRDSPSHSAQVSFADGLHAADASFDASAAASSPRVYIKRHSRRISVSPADISLLSDQNAELLLKLENLEAEAQSSDNVSRRRLRQLEKELQGLRDELERTQARSEQLEKKVHVGTEQIVEEMWKKKKEREAKFRAMRNNTSRPGPDDSEIRDFAPAGFFSKTSFSPSPSTEFEVDASYGSEPDFEHPHQHAVVSQLLSKIQELEETNVQIIRQQSETTDKLQAVQRETESISKVYECFSAENGVEWEVVDDDGVTSPMDGTIRFKSFRRTLDAEGEYRFPTSLTMPRKARKSVLNLFDVANESKLAPSPLYESTELSPLRFGALQSQPDPRFGTLQSQPDSRFGNQSDYGISPFLGSRPTLQAELGDDFISEVDPFLQRSSLYDLSFSMSPSPTPASLSSRSLRGRVSDARASREPSTSVNNALQLSVEPPSPSDQDTDETGSLREKNKERHRRMSQTLSLRTNRWAGGRFPGGSSPFIGESTPKRQPSVSFPQRLSTALDIVMENFTRPARAEDDDTDSPSASPVSVSAENSALLADSSAVVAEDSGPKKQAFVAFVLEIWLWLQFGIIILVFLWAMAKRGPKSVLGEAERRAVVRQR